MIEVHGNARTDGRKDKETSLQDPSSYHWGSKIRRSDFF